MPRKDYQPSSEEPVVQQQLKSEILSRFSGVLSESKRGAWEYGLTFLVQPQNACEVFRTLRDEAAFDFKMLIDVTAVDWLDRREPRFDVVYQLLSVSKNHRLTIKIQVPEEAPVVDSVRDIWPTANFLEREVWDMYGVEFKGHNDLRRIMMYDEFVGHPLRKDYPIRGKQPRVQMRIPELRNTSADMERGQLVAMPTGRRERKSASI